MHAVIKPARSVVAVVMIALAGCIGQGEGEASGTISVPICKLDGQYDLEPTFFGANREGTFAPLGAGRALTLRIQHGGGTADYTDNLSVTVDDTYAVARRIADSSVRDPDGSPTATFVVGPTGVPGVLVHAVLSPNHSCGRVKVSRLGRNVGLPAVSGKITFRSIDLGDNPRETYGQADPRLTDVPSFQIIFDDPRPVGLPAPDNVQPESAVGHAELYGRFRFRFSRPAPAQQFP